MSVYGFKLVSGEEILGKVSGASLQRLSGESKQFGPSKITIENPAILAMIPDERNRPTPGLADFLPFSNKKEITIEESHIVFTYEPVLPMVNGYNAKFGSGLVQAKALPENIFPFTKN